MAEPPKSPERRWYDTISNMTMALHLSKQLPTEIQGLIAEHLNHAIDEHRKRGKADKHTTSLGPQRTLSLYKAATKKRWYDEQPTFHRAMTMMIGLPHPYLSEFASRLLNVAQYWDSQQHYGNYGDRFLLNDTVESILKADPMLLNQTEDGIKLVMGNPQQFLEPTNSQQQNFLPIRRHKPGR